jgi:hypothetical protein
MEQLEQTQYDQGKKWWDPTEHANADLTPQKPLLDGAEGKLVDSSEKDNYLKMTLSVTSGGGMEMIRDEPPSTLMEVVMTVL